MAPAGKAALEPLIKFGNGIAKPTKASSAASGRAAPKSDLNPFDTRALPVHTKRQVRAQIASRARPSDHAARVRESARAGQCKGWLARWTRRVPRGCIAPPFVVPGHAPSRSTGEGAASAWLRRWRC
jgi:hypothetical protein